MARAGDVLNLTDSEQLTFRTTSADSGGELVEVAVKWNPSGTHKPPPHFHPSQDEHFEISSGELSARIGSETRVLRAGDTLDIPRGTVHTLWNAGSVPAEASWQVRPALNMEGFWEEMHALRAAGHRNKNGTIDLPAAALLFRCYSDEFRLAMPSVVTGPLFALLAGWARLRGYPPVGQQAGSSRRGAATAA